MFQVSTEKKWWERIFLRALKRLQMGDRTGKGLKKISEFREFSSFKKTKNQAKYDTRHCFCLVQDRYNTRKMEIFVRAELKPFEDSTTPDRCARNNKKLLKWIVNKIITSIKSPKKLRTYGKHCDNNILLLHPSSCIHQ